MNAKCTPELWSVDRDDRPNMTWNNHIVCGDATICFMAHSGHADNANAEANANLIAAAPELYEALELVLDALGALTKPKELREGYGLSNNQVDSIYAALKKARGEA